MQSEGRPLILGRGAALAFRRRAGFSGTPRIRPDDPNVLTGPCNVYLALRRPEDASEGAGNPPRLDGSVGGAGAGEAIEGYERPRSVT